MTSERRIQVLLKLLSEDDALRHALKRRGAPVGEQGRIERAIYRIEPRGGREASIEGMELFVRLLAPDGAWGEFIELKRTGATLRSAEATEILRDLASALKKANRVLASDRFAPLRLLFRRSSPALEGLTLGRWLLASRAYEARARELIQQPPNVSPIRHRPADRWRSNFDRGIVRALGAVGVKSPSVRAAVLGCCYEASEQNRPNPDALLKRVRAASQRK